MPASGADSPVFRSLNSDGGLAARLQRLMTPPIEPTVCEQAPEGAEQAEEHQQSPVR